MAHAHDEYNVYIIRQSRRSIQTTTDQLSILLDHRYNTTF